MKYQLKPTNKFKQDLKLAKKRGYNIQLLKDVLEMLADGQILPEKYRDHDLQGNFKGCRECHINRVDGRISLLRTSRCTVRTGLVYGAT